jgi:hypothetical protein
MLESILFNEKKRMDNKEGKSALAVSWLEINVQNELLGILNKK